MAAIFKSRVFWLVVLALVAIVIIFLNSFNPASLVHSQQQKNDELIAEQLAEHVGAMAYVYGYPLVDMAKQMHNETHRTGPEQQVYAPVNRFHRFPEIVGPDNGGNFRLPNNDTLYFSGWFDISEGPVIIHTPDTDGRYFTIAVTNLYAEASHIGRRTHGTDEAYYALVPPGWQGQLPAGAVAIEVESQTGWLLGRVLVDGPDDHPAALAVMNGIWMASLNEFQPGKAPAALPAIEAKRINPLQSLDYFTYMHKALKSLPGRASEAALMAQFDAIGLGPNSEFDIDRLDEATRTGLQKGLAAGMAIVKASEARSTPSHNGWMSPRKIGRYGFDYLQRASVVANGYGNLPEESTYAATLTDADGQMLGGAGAYTLDFEPGATPPVNGFWSITAYALPQKQVEENAIGRYSFGDRTQGVQYSEDGSLSLKLQVKQPEDSGANWLPVPSGYFILVVRMYEPGEEILKGEYRLPAIHRQGG